MSTKGDILNALAVELEAITAIKKATRFTLLMSKIENNVPYIGIVSADEEKQVEDSTDIRWRLDVALYLVTEQQNEGIEGLLDDIKEAILGTTCPINIHANLDLITIGSIDPVYLEDLDDGKYSSTRIMLELIYNSSNGGF